MILQPGVEVAYSYGFIKRLHFLIDAQQLFFCQRFLLKNFVSIKNIVLYCYCKKHIIIVNVNGATIAML